MQRRLCAAVTLGSIAALVGATAQAPADTTPAHATRDWSTYNYDVLRQGTMAEERRLNLGTVPRLRASWSASLGAALNGQAVIAHAVTLRSKKKATLAYVGTEHGDIYALSASTGRVVWRRHLGTTQNCHATPDGIWGITGTPTIDRARGVVYAVDGRGRAYALRLGSGSVVRGWPRRVVHDPGHEHVWGALTLWRGRLYAAVASYCDEPPYYGAVVAVNTATRRTTTWRVTGGTPYMGGGIWGWGGVSIDPRNGDVFAATGNSLSQSETDGYSERVVRLSRTLRVRESGVPVPREKELDRDYGSTPVLYRSRGCPMRAAAENKTGAMLIYDARGLRRGPVQTVRIARAPGANEFGLIGEPTFSARSQMLYVTTPYEEPLGRGLLAFRVGRHCRLQFAWRLSVARGGIKSSPVVGGDVVYFGDGRGKNVYAASARSGRLLWTQALEAPTFATPTPYDGRLYVPSWDGRLHTYKVPPRSGR